MIFKGLCSVFSLFFRQVEAQIEHLYWIRGVRTSIFSDAFFLKKKVINVRHQYQKVKWNFKWWFKVGQGWELHS